MHQRISKDQPRNLCSNRKCHQWQKRSSTCYCKYTLCGLQ